VSGDWAGEPLTKNHLGPSDSETRFGASYHMHTSYCDGKTGVEEMVRAAVEAGLSEVGISSHSPLTFRTDWNMDAGRLPDYVAEVRRVGRQFADRIRVLLGMELDFIPDPSFLAFREGEIFPHDFDYFIGSVHYLDGGPSESFDGFEEGFRTLLSRSYAGDIEAMVLDYYSRVRQMLETPRLRIVGHLDVIKRWNAAGRYFRADEPWYVKQVSETLDAISASGHLVEINTSGWRKGVGEPYPSEAILAACRDRDIPIIISSDAHRPSEVIQDFERAADLLASLGITPRRFLDA
jgi:histidinol-phosphatase (PHP family)